MLVEGQSSVEVLERCILKAVHCQWDQHILLRDRRGVPGMEDVKDQEGSDGEKREHVGEHGLFRLAEQ